MKIRDRIVDFRRVSARDLLPNPKNWCRHPQQQQDALRGLLSEIGYADALLVRQVDGGLQLLDGHLRAETTPDMDVPVLVLDLDDAEADKLLVTLDPLAGMAEADVDDLRTLLDQVSTGSDAVQALLENLAYQVGPPAVVVGLTDPDDVPEPPEEPTAKRGDVWLCGDHRVMCGDSTEEADVSRLMAGETASLMVTDPPYGVAYESAGKRKKRLSENRYVPPAARSAASEPLTNDDLPEEEQATFWREAFSDWPLSGDAYIFSPSGPLMLALFRSIIEAGIVFSQTLIWVKDQLALGRQHYHYRHEHIIYGWKGKTSWNGSRQQDSIWEAQRQAINEYHPTQKPVALCERAIENSSRCGAVVLDPFLGSGTTMIAAERLGRRCYGMEIESRYVDMAVKRWEAFTGRKAVLDIDAPLRAPWEGPAGVPA